MAKKTFLDIESLNRKEREALEAILAKDPSAITAGDAGVLRARIDYLTSDQREVFAEALVEPKE